MRTATFLRTANPVATRLALVALAALMFKALVLNQITAPKPQVHDLCVIVEAILASIVASYVFYLFVVHLKEATDKETLAPYLDRHTLRVIGDCQSQLSEISKVSGISLSLDTINVQDLTNAFSKIAPYSNAPLVLSPANTHANWFQYFEYHKNRSKESIARVFGQVIYLEAKHVGLLAAVDDCSHFSFISHMVHTKVSNPSLSAFASTFFSYCEACASLNQYMTEKQARSAA